MMSLLFIVITAAIATAGPEEPVGRITARWKNVEGTFVAEFTAMREALLPRDVFRVTRGNKAIGEVSVLQVQGARAMVIATAGTKVELQVGDRLVFARHSAAIPTGLSQQEADRHMAALRDRTPAYVPGRAARSRSSGISTSTPSFGGTWSAGRMTGTAPASSTSADPGGIRTAPTAGSSWSGGRVSDIEGNAIPSGPVSTAPTGSGPRSAPTAGATWSGGRVSDIDGRDIPSGPVQTTAASGRPQNAPTAAGSWSAGRISDAEGRDLPGADPSQPSLSLPPAADASGTASTIPGSGRPAASSGRSGSPCPLTVVAYRPYVAETGYIRVMARIRNGGSAFAAGVVTVRFVDFFEKTIAMDSKVVALGAGEACDLTLFALLPGLQSLHQLDTSRITADISEGAFRHHKELKMVFEVQTQK